MTIEDGFDTKPVPRVNRWRRTVVTQSGGLDEEEARGSLILSPASDENPSATNLQAADGQRPHVSGGRVRRLQSQAPGLGPTVAVDSRGSADRGASAPGIAGDPSQSHSGERADGEAQAGPLTEPPRSLEDAFQSDDAAAAFRDGLADAGFAAVGADVFVEPVRGVTVEMLTGQVFICVDHQRPEDVDAFVATTLASPATSGDLVEFARGFGARLLAWVQGAETEDGGAAPAAQDRNEIDDASDESGEEDVRGVNASIKLDLGLLPSAAQLGATAARRLVVVTYGCSVVRQRPSADRHYCIDDKRIRYRLSGRNAAKCCGLDELIQARVCRCAFFATFVEDIVRDVEANRLSVIAIFCWKGRHRSVAAAEILRRAYYPEASLQHHSV